MNQMNEKMIIKVLPAEGSNPEFEPEKELQDGIECYGYVLMTFNEEHDLDSAHISNLSLKNITDAIISTCDEDAISTLRQAFVVAEGFIKAAKIRQDNKRDNMMKRMKKVLSGVNPDEDYGDEFPEDEIQDFPEEE